MRIATPDLVTNSYFPERDLLFYDPVISPAAVAAMNTFAQAIGLRETPVAYDAVVATRFRSLWSPPS
jgi:hypothetical protein